MNFFILLSIITLQIYQKLFFKNTKKSFLFKFMDFYIFEIQIKTEEIKSFAHRKTTTKRLVFSHKA